MNIKRAGFVLIVILLLQVVGTTVQASNNFKLLKAIQQNNKEKVQFFVAQGADPNVKLKMLGGITPLALAASKGNPEIVQLLINQGAEVDLEFNAGWTPLMVAAKRED